MSLDSDASSQPAEPVKGKKPRTPRQPRPEAGFAGEKLRLLQAQRFQAMNQFAGGVAHEFNNLIAGILGSAELVAMGMPEGHPGHDTLKQIFEASNQARDFVHKLRAMGQRTSAEFKTVRLQQVIEECLQVLRTITDKVEVITQIDPDCPPVHADAAQLHQAILDLCLHVWHGFAERRGQIKISLEYHQTVNVPAGVSCLLQAGPHICLMIQDDGPGLDKSASQNIFHPFRNRRSGGKKMGLELFLVREVIQGHHGDIFLESEPGLGQKFYIYLPAAV